MSRKMLYMCDQCGAELGPAAGDTQEYPAIYLDGLTLSVPLGSADLRHKDFCSPACLMTAIAIATKELYHT